MATLKRSLGAGMLALYGLGTTIGAGVFVLSGRVAAEAGVWAPFAFVVASIAAGLSACAFARLSKRFPEAAGEAAYVREGLGAPSLAAVVGYAVALAGLISAATIAHGFAGYLARLAPLPEWALLIAFAGLIGAVAAWGVTQSVAIAAAITLLEAGVLIVVCGLGGPAVAEHPEALAGALPPMTLDGWTMALAGGVIAFYAFIGFEDIVNMAEEARRPEQALPLAIAITLVVTTALYLGVAVVSLAAMPLDALAASKAPLADVFQSATGFSARPIEIIAVVSVLNGALIQAIKCARVLYGLARNGKAPKVFAYVSPRTRTPVVGVWTAAAVILALALLFPLEDLARVTAFITLAVFVLVNLAAARLGGAGARVTALLAVLACGALMAAELARQLG